METMAHTHNDGITTLDGIASEVEIGDTQSEIPIPIPEGDDPNVMSNNYELDEDGNFLYIKEEVVQESDGSNMYSEQGLEHGIKVGENMIDYAASQKSMEEIIDVLNTTDDLIEKDQQTNQGDVPDHDDNYAPTPTPVNISSSSNKPPMHNLRDIETDVAVRSIVSDPSAVSRQPAPSKGLRSLLAYEGYYNHNKTVTPPVKRKDLNKSGNIKRPMNAFMVWAKQYRPYLSAKMVNCTNSDISVRLGHIWNEMTEAEKQPYYNEAEKLKREHRKKYPDWVYRPVKRVKREENNTTTWERPREKDLGTITPPKVPCLYPASECAYGSSCTNPLCNNPTTTSSETTRPAQEYTSQDHFPPPRQYAVLPSGPGTPYPHNSSLPGRPPSKAIRTDHGFHSPAHYHPSPHHHQSPPNYTWPTPPEHPSRHPESHKYNPYVTANQPAGEPNQAQDGTGDGSKTTKTNPPSVKQEENKMEPAESEKSINPPSTTQTPQSLEPKSPAKSAEPNARQIEKSKATPIPPYQPKPYLSMAPGYIHGSARWPLPFPAYPLEQHRAEMAERANMMDMPFPRGPYPVGDHMDDLRHYGSSMYKDSCSGDPYRSHWPEPPLRIPHLDMNCWSSYMNNDCPYAVCPSPGRCSSGSFHAFHRPPPPTLPPHLLKTLPAPPAHMPAPPASHVPPPTQAPPPPPSYGPAPVSQIPPPASHVPPPPSYVQAPSQILRSYVPPPPSNMSLLSSHVPPSQIPHISSILKPVTSSVPPACQVPPFASSMPPTAAHAHPPIQIPPPSAHVAPPSNVPLTSSHVPPVPSNMPPAHVQQLAHVAPPSQVPPAVSTMPPSVHAQQPPQIPPPSSHVPLPSSQVPPVVSNMPRSAHAQPHSQMPPSSHVAPAPSNVSLPASYAPLKSPQMPTPSHMPPPSPKPAPCEPVKQEK